MVRLYRVVNLSVNLFCSWHAYFRYFWLICALVYISEVAFFTVWGERWRHIECLLRWWSLAGTEWLCGPKLLRLRGYERWRRGDKGGRSEGLNKGSGWRLGRWLRLLSLSGKGLLLLEEQRCAYGTSIASYYLLLLHLLVFPLVAAFVSSRVVFAPVVWATLALSSSVVSMITSLISMVSSVITAMTLVLISIIVVMTTVTVIVQITGLEVDRRQTRL